MKKILNQISIKIAVIVIVIITTPFFAKSNQTEISYLIDESSSYYVTAETWDTAPGGGDTIYISSERTKALRFQELSGDKDNPIVVINKGGQVQIDAPDAWGAITFENCQFIKVSGTGHAGYKYGFTLSANTCGLAFSELSSDCEAEFIKISHEGFFGIMAKKNYDGNPPSPAPVFANLVIHDCFIENVTEGMYLGETTSPGMEFKHVKIYNNIVRNTGREAVQIANMVEDVEIYNNTLLNAGQDNETWQNNILQIGDNSVANVYNNILIGAPEYGIITMGMGNNIFSNNYISSCKGAFIDNRLFSEENYPIVFSGNYFVNNSGDEIIKNMNEINNIVINNNTYDTDIDFFTNASGVDSNLVFANNKIAELDTISFTSPDSNDYSLSEATPEIYAYMGAPGGEEYFEYKEDTVTEDTIASEQIILTSDMIVDLVDGGSIYPADYLVDEQSYTPENGLHPISESWKPYWNMNYGPYHVYIDLGETYNITNIALHDMYNSQNLVVSAGEPGNWETLFTEPCDKYKTWKENSTNISTRYIRLSMNEGVYAAVNEIVIYGYKDSTSTSEKSASTGTSKSSFSIEEEQTSNIELVKNPVSDNLRFNISEDLETSFSIEVFDINGSKILSKNFINNFQSQELNISISEYNLKNGLYIIRYLNSNRVQKTMKFVKTS
ncbi:T9SS type A sorting domain-containing protein [Maribellus maritimus]|uniref:T9SS type A sorting domain-containing protein n=1 Tax=Maribellus maritimus TaxID=2870838 RepID=UPI001EE9B7CC|nr:T9SS type A sorting domain-containing protein [Maribellus maritimus]MCG6186903.1 T9SS type A sorting domain-containing protein [Maribellus maritimus]